MTMRQRVIYAAALVLALIGPAGVSEAATLQVRRFELERARAQLVSPTARQQSDDCECLELVAPVTGQVLRVLRESAGVVAAAEPLLEIGDPRELEIVADLLLSHRRIADRVGPPASIAKILQTTPLQLAALASAGRAS